jgi:hypothetical protein
VLAKQSAAALTKLRPVMLKQRTAAAVRALLRGGAASA